MFRHRELQTAELETRISDLLPTAAIMEGDDQDRLVPILAVVLKPLLDRIDSLEQQVAQLKLQMPTRMTTVGLLEARARRHD